MSAARGKNWFLLHDRDGRVAAVERELDVIDLEIDALRQIKYAETKERLERLGIGTTNFRPPPQMLRSEQRCLNHLTDDDDIEAIIVAAQESPLDRAYREHIAAKRRAAADEEVSFGVGQVIRRPGGEILGVR